MRQLLRRVGPLLAVFVLSAALAEAPAQAESDGRRSETSETRSHGTLVSLPPIIQPGTVPSAPPNGARLVATFEPARPGSAVRLERLRAGGWKQVARKRQDAWGSAAFAVPPGSYRARTESPRGDETITGRVVSRTWTPAFEDTFSGTALDASVWNDQRREHESVYAPRTCARTDPATRRVEGGVLHLGIALDPERLHQRCHYQAPKGPGEQSYLLTSQVATEHTRLFHHGIVAARIKPQQARGMHSAFWMLPEGTVFGDGDPSAGTEIDIVEFFGATPRGRETIGSFVSYYNPGWQSVKLGALFRDARRALGEGAHWWDEFHVFSVERTPVDYIFRIDGREYHRETSAVSMAQQYLVLSMLASDHELAELTADELDDTAEVDWVRVYDVASTTSRRSR